MGISVKTGKKACSIVLSGGVGIEHILEFFSHVKENLKKNISIDMCEVESIDTSLVQVILAASNAAEASGGTLRLLSPPTELMGVLASVGFGPNLQIN